MSFVTDPSQKAIEGHAPPEGRDEAEEAALERCIERARARYPTLHNDPAIVRKALLRGAPSESSARVAFLDRARADEVWLAASCAAGDAPALEDLERTIRPEIQRIATRSRRSAVDADDLLQQVFQKLLVSDEKGPPRILEFNGQGELKAWLRVVATRTVVDIARKKSGHEDAHNDADAVMAIVGESADPEIAYLKRHYRTQFVEAFQASLQGLAPEDKVALRLHYVERLTVDQIAAVQSVHRATAARRVQNAREDLLASTRRRLVTALRMSQAELESVMRLIESQLHVSLERLLA
ncbi:MAG: sigma-70 family RNA polymerase sigma factor [Polyangiaceae bacterium]